MRIGTYSVLVAYTLLKFKQPRYMDCNLRRVLPPQVISKVTEFVQTQQTAQTVAEVNRPFEPLQSDPENVERNKVNCSISNDCHCVECSSHLLVSNTNSRVSNDFSEIHDESRLLAAAYDESYKAREREENKVEKSTVKYTRHKADSDKNWRDREKTFKQAPNYFVSVKISSQQIVDSMRRVQEALLLAHPQLEQVMIPIATLHLTLMVMRLDTEEHIQRAKLALENSGLKIRELYKQLVTMHLCGVGSFGGSVLFAKIANHDDMKCFAEIVAEKFSELNIVSTEGELRTFKPHVTILKFSKLFNRRQPKKTEKLEIRKVSKDMYSEFEAMEFGSDIIRSIQLCSMMKPKDAAGYYFVEHEVSLVNSSQSN